MKKVILGLLIGISFVSGGDLECTTSMLDSKKAYSQFKKYLNAQNLELSYYYLDAYKTLIMRVEIECREEMNKADYDKLIKTNNSIARSFESVLRNDIQDNIRRNEIRKTGI